MSTGDKMYSIDVERAQPDRRLEALIINNAEPHIQTIAENNFAIVNVHVQISPYLPIWIVVQGTDIIDRGIFAQRQHLVFQYRMRDPLTSRWIPYFLTFEEI